MMQENNKKNIIKYVLDEDQQKEQDMQIGLPTDVKHVAHVGWDGPGSASSTSVDSPNWVQIKSFFYN